MPAANLNPTPNLAELLQGMVDAPPLPIADIASDSRRITNGSLFLARRGGSGHALDYLDATQSTRLAAIAWDGDSTARLPVGVPAVVVPDISARLGEIANRWFATPSAAIEVASVTGTNGKTTVAWLLAQCWQLLGEGSGYIGTLGSGSGDVVQPAGDERGLTTPDCIELHRQLAAFRDEGTKHVAIEASSHGIAQGRLDGVQLTTAVFTNLSRDHIDFHGDMGAYGDTKARLFTDYSATLRVICIDSEFGKTLARRCGPDAVLVASDDSYATAGHRYLFATDVQATDTGSRFTLKSSFGTADCHSPLFGLFNVANVLEVLAVLLCSGVELAVAVDLLQSISAPPGRMEQVTTDADGDLPRVFVDYAHTPAALEAALRALRPHCHGKLWCVFGCGGDRDAGKRPQMGQVVERFADHPVLTSDNPRSEDPAAIMDDVRRGMSGQVTAIEDRAAAIALAIRGAAGDDIVLVAGKGHEDYQLLGERRLTFSDRLVALCNLQQRQAS